jgi:hypothetical protein
MRPPFAGHGGQLLNWSLATTTKKYFIQRNQYIFASPWHEEEPAPAQTSRAPPCLPHGLSAEGIGSQATMSARMKSLFREYLGQSSISVLPPKTNDKNYIGTMTSYPLRPRFPLIHTFFSLLPPEKDRVCHPAVCNRYPASPRKKIASATGHGNEGARQKFTLFFSASPGERSSLPSCYMQLISGFPPDKRLHRQQAMEMREPSQQRGATIRRIILDDLLFLRGRRQGEKGGRDTRTKYQCTWHCQ